ncbi:hypothetical protein KKC13_05250 [bacterium]|nr:hypothetical protein [bacterium]MBU1959374.1 hypothetical protein [bacterium]
MNQEIYTQKLENAIYELKKLELYRLDSDTKLLKEAFEILYKHDIFSLYKVDKALHNAYKFILFSQLTKVSGSLAFLVIQILAANAIMAGNGFPKREEYFAKRCGIAINHLRAPVTVVSATKSEEGYLLNGTLTWVSGYGIFDTLLIGFHYDGYEYEAMAPFKSSETFNIGEVATSFVGNSMATVNIELKEFFVPFDEVVSSQLMGNYTKAKSVSKTIHFALYGLGLGAIETLKDEEVKKRASEKLELIKEQFLNTNDGAVMDSLRIELFMLVQKVITTGMVLYGGKSILIEEQMQRYYRELIMFNSNGLNDEIKELFRDEFLKSIC